MAQFTPVTNRRAASSELPEKQFCCPSSIHPWITLRGNLRQSEFSSTNRSACSSLLGSHPKAFLASGKETCPRGARNVRVFDDECLMKSPAVANLPNPAGIPGEERRLCPRKQHAGNCLQGVHPAEEVI